MSLTEILDGASFRNQATAIPALPGATSIQKVAGALSSVDDQGVVTTLGGAGGITALTGDVTASGTGSVAATIAAGAVTLAKQANLAANSIQGNNTGSPATPIALTAAQTITLLGLATVATSGSASDLSAGTLPAGRFPAQTGDVTNSAGSLATTIAASAVTMSKIANAGAASIVGATGAGAHADLTGTQALSIIVNDTTTVVTVAGSAVQDVTFSGLAGNTDGNYECKWYAPSGFGGANLSLQPNADGSNSEVTGTYQSHASGAPVQNNYGRLQISSSGSTAASGVFYFASKTGRGNRLYREYAYDAESGVNFKWEHLGWYTDTTTAITSLKIHSDTAAAIPVGTVFVLRKLGEL